MNESTPATGIDAGKWDRLGVWASIACAAHCLVAPFLFLAVPTFAGIWAHPSSHALVALLVLPLAAMVLLRGYRSHQRHWVAAAAMVGMGCILVGCALPFLEDGGEAAAAATTACQDNCCPQIVQEEDGSTTLGWPPASIATLLGSVLLVASHMGNLACCRSCLGPGA